MWVGESKSLKLRIKEKINKRCYKTNVPAIKLSLMNNFKRKRSKQLTHKLQMETCQFFNRRNKRIKSRPRQNQDGITSDRKIMMKLQNLLMKILKGPKYHLRLYKANKKGKIFRLKSNKTKKK